MPDLPLTAEQLAIARHDPTRHATVLAVAGAGKTTAMAHRIRYLVDTGVPGSAIRAVMYNKSARDDFAGKLDALDLGEIRVQTFHSVGYGILRWAQAEGRLPPFTLATDARAVRDLARHAIEAADAGGDEARLIDPDDAIEAIGTWKSMLTAPADALHTEDPTFERIYSAFERRRQRERFVTYDDMIYDAVRLLERDDVVRDRMVDRLEHLIVDEFQDVNHARLRLLQILAGRRARVMVVGDDDQCIYEWQGARSSFIKRGFVAAFTHHPHTTYKLTRSFRFGPAIAQLSANVIGHNTDRVDKDLVANDLAIDGTITLDAAPPAGGVRQALPRLRELLDAGTPASRIAVLVRKHSQATLLQSLLLAHQIPFFVEDTGPLRDAYPVKLAVWYLDAARGLDLPLTSASAAAAAYVVNRPPRFVKRVAFEGVLREATARGWTLAQLLTDRERLRGAGLVHGAVGKLRSLERRLRIARDGADPGRDHNAGHALGWLIDNVPFGDLFAAFEGPSAVEEDLNVMRSLALLLREAKVAVAQTRAFLDALDSRAGRPEAECVRITTVFKAKGLEWDHVLLPDLLEGQTPDLRATVNVAVNRRDPGRAPDPTQTLESERRLFYVALTRARRSVHLFADPDDRRPLSRFVHEACVDATVDAVGALQDLAEHGDDAHRGCIDRLREGARTDGRLREGLLKMLRLAAQQAPPHRETPLAAATLAVNEIDAAPFSYPRAYPDPRADKAPPPPPPPTDTGLPF